MITLIVPAVDPEQGQRIMDGLVDRAGVDVHPLLIDDHQRSGYTAACNRGLAQALERGTDACICVDDVEPVTDNWLARLNQALYLNNSIWFAGPSGACRTPPQNSGRVDDPRPVQYVSHVAGFCWLIKNVALQRVGLMREELSNYGSEVDYQWRARAQGGRTVWVPDVYVKHELHAPRQPEWDEDNERFDAIWS